MTPPSKNIPYGLCLCGCGAKTNLSPVTRKSIGIVRGMPLRYIANHHRRKSPVEYVVEDMGYRTPCWVWQRAKTAAGYGQLAASGYNSAHVAYYVREFGSIPDGMELDHLCRVRACVNPRHMEPVTSAVNVQRGSRCKLNEKSVANILTLLHRGVLQYHIAEKFGVSRSHISRISTGNYWANVPRRV